MKKNLFEGDGLTTDKVRVLLFLVSAFIIMLLYAGMEKNIYRYSEEAGVYKEDRIYKGRGIITGYTDKEKYVELMVVPGEKRKYVAEEKILLRIYDEEIDETYINALCEFEFSYRPLEENDNFGTFDSKAYYNSLGIAGTYEGENIRILKKKSNLGTYIAKANKYMEKNIYDAMGDKYGSVMAAMVLGNKYSMDDYTKELYSRNGLAHILAVSGLHISTVGLILYNILRKMMSVKISAFLSMLVMFLYGILTGGSVSCMRAVIMFIIMQGSLITGRKYNIYNSIIISAIVILFINPFYIRNSSFIMSYVAIISVSVIMPEINFILGKLKNKYVTFAMPFITGLIINILMVPLVCMYYYELPVLSVILNLLVVPLTSAILFSGIICGLTGDVLEISGHVSGYIGKILLWLCEKICEAAEKLPGTVFVTGKPQIKEVILFYIVLLLVFLLLRYVRIAIKRKENKKLKTFKFQMTAIGSILLFIVSLFCVINNNHITGDRAFISFIDVGQGDCIFIRDHKGKTYLIDSGSSDEKNIAKYKVSPHLKALGVGKIDYVFITHGDEDHISGIEEMLEDGHLMKIEKLVVAECQKEDEAIKNLVKKAKRTGIKVVYVCEDMKLNNEEFSIKCLYPGKAINVSMKDDSNEKSLVLSVKYREFKILLTGDIGIETEKILLKNYSQDISETDILKVAHHGSKNSNSQEFLECVAPKISVISCGEGNMYGHPSSEALERLKCVGSKVMITMEQGGIMMKLSN